MTSSPWDDPDLMQGGEFFTFENVGDTISGTINAIRKQLWTDGTSSPQLLITTDDGDERTVTAGATRLKAELVKLRPNVGDHISIRLDDVEKRGGGKTLKYWAVEVTPGNAPAKPATAPAQPATETPAQPVDMAAALAALSALTPEARAGLGL